MQDTLLMPQTQDGRQACRCEPRVPGRSGELARYPNTICQWLTNINGVPGWLMGVWMGQAVWSAFGVLLREMSTCVHDSLSPKGAKAPRGSAHVAFLSSPGYNNESHCVLCAPRGCYCFSFQLTLSNGTNAARHTKLHRPQTKTTFSTQTKKGSSH